ncbi:MAG: Xaa-Pro dipeptidase [Myxococcota bacterium]|jgi:Xaa-Pro dipeptidase|nr:Xaa-Pro dipeptidase [Myxococcota bacterium]
METVAEHIREIEAACTRALELTVEAEDGFDSILFHAGSSAHYHRDDLAVPFRSNAHFLRFGWIEGPGHLLLFRPGERTRLFRSVETDFWFADTAPVDDELMEAFEVIETDDVVSDALDCEGLGRRAFVGADREVAHALGIEDEACEPRALMSALDWACGIKTDYEIDCTREATRIAALGHTAVRDALPEGATEFELHLVYLAATGQTDEMLPYPNIIAWDEGASVLHYQHRRTTKPSPGRVLLIDAGARHRGYASDITRTYHVDGGEPDSAPFGALLAGMESLQQQLAQAVGPGVEFVDLHRQAEHAIAELLAEVGLLRTSVEEAREQGVVFAFFPHGLGHPLGLQTHDVGGHLEGPYGFEIPPPDDCPHLRNTRKLAPRNVVTIEPGLYFIPSLLDPLRGRDALDWKLVDALIPYGGIRIEDDIVVTDTGNENLTRPFLP